MSVLTLDDIKDLAEAALHEHGLDAKGWTFAWDRAVRRAGQCHFGKKQISLSKPIFSKEHNREDALDTILHEVAHAIAGPGANHGPKWKRVAENLGARPEVYHSLATPERKVHGTCACEGRVFKSHRLPRKKTYICPTCREIITWTRKG